MCIFNTEASSAPPVQLQWLMVTWIPDGCKVRDKMLYSSSREDLKRTIGMGYFKSEYAANYLSDISWEMFQKSLVKEIDASVLTENERLALEEKVHFHTPDRCFICWMCTFFKMVILLWVAAANSDANRRVCKSRAARIKAQRWV